MSRSERENFVPTTAVEARADRLSRDWNDATERAYTVPLHFARAAEKMGDFGQSAIETAIDEVRETYDAGYQTYNLIEEVLESDCDGKWSMLLKTALPAAGAALWLLLVPQPQEILEEYLTPKNLKSTGRGGADAKKVKRKPGKSGRIRRIFPRLPDTNKLIADMIPGSQWVQGRRVGRADRWLFTGINVADRIFWHWLVLEATETFFTTWSSGIMESRFCSSPINVVVVAEAGPLANTIDVADLAATAFEVSEGKGLANDGANLGNFEVPSDVTISINWRIKYFDSQPVGREKPVTMVMIDGNGQVTFKEYPAAIQEDDDGKFIQLEIDESIDNLKTFDFQITTSGAPLFGSTMDIAVFGTQSP